MGCQHGRWRFNLYYSAHPPHECGHFMRARPVTHILLASVLGLTPTCCGELTSMVVHWGFYSSVPFSVSFPSMVPTHIRVSALPTWGM